VELSVTVVEATRVRKRRAFEFRLWVDAVDKVGGAIGLVPLAAAGLS
jgi:hypothetical protein